MREYRVIEFLSEFTIQTKVTTTTGMLWWKKSIDDWYSIDSTGRAWWLILGRSIMPMPKFKTLDKAKEKVAELNKGEIIHIANPIIELTYYSKKRVRELFIEFKDEFNETQNTAGDCINDSDIDKFLDNI